MNLVLHGDILDCDLPPNSIDALITDPPSGRAFMRQKWDTFQSPGHFQEFLRERFLACHPAMKPGAFGAIWCFPRMCHRVMNAAEEAGFITQDVVSHIFHASMGKNRRLKPAMEFWVIVQKPISERSIKANVAKWGVGHLQIDACEIPRDPDDIPGWHASGADGSGGYHGTDTFRIRAMSAGEIRERRGDRGRYPCNVTVDSGAVAWLEHNTERYFPVFKQCPKPSVAEKDAGLEEFTPVTVSRLNSGGLSNEPRFAPVSRHNPHPTVKPIALCRWLCRLLCPVGGTVLDPFAGSGTTLVAAGLERMSGIGFDIDQEMCEIANARIKHWLEEKDE